MKYIKHLTLVAVLIGLICSQSVYGAQAPADTLILVNGYPITVSDFDQMVADAHKTMKMEDQSNMLADQLLEKKVNEILMVQDAIAAEMDQNPDFVKKINDNEQKYAIQEYVKDNLVLPEVASQEMVREYFENYYYQVQFRQLSVRTKEEAEQMQAKVLDGADMDALAKEFSLDSKNLIGGLHNLLFWIDVENIFRDQLTSMSVGQLSDIFPINDAFAFIRLEKKLPLDEDLYPKFEKKINSLILGQNRQVAWDGFVEKIIEENPFQEDIAIMMSVLADSGIVLEPEFSRIQPGNIIEIKNGNGISGTEFREKLSFEFKSDTTIPFSKIFNDTRDLVMKELVLSKLAKEGGYFDSPNVIKRTNQDWESELIQFYLNETVVPNITFNRKEFDEFYQLNLDNFRGPDEVRMNFLILKDKPDAEIASKRLRDGADFGRIFQEYNHGQEISTGESKFIKMTELSSNIKEALKTMEPGQSSLPIEMGAGYMVFRLDAMKKGTVPPIEMVEIDIRRAIYQKKFNDILDKNLDLLRTNSEIIRWMDRIDEYLNPAGESN